MSGRCVFIHSPHIPAVEQIGNLIQKASRLPGEPAGRVDDYQIHPAEPCNVRVTATYRF